MMKKDDELRGIKELLEIVKHKVDTMNSSVTAQLASFMVMKDFQSMMNSKLDDVIKDLEKVKQVQAEHTDLLERRLLPSVTEIETKVDSYADAYKTNKANIERLDERVTRFEDQEGYLVPSNLVIQR